MLARIKENGMGETVGMQDLFREDFSIMVEVIDPEPAEVTRQEYIDITIAGVAMEFALDVFPPFP